MTRAGFPWIHIAVVTSVFTLICRLLDVWPDAGGYSLLIATLALFIYMAKGDWIAWIPIAITGILMYLARITNIGVTDYNLFLLILIGWSTLLVFFYRNLTVRRRQNGK
jgi:cell division protein FtsW (lipid II flippase)